MSKDVLEGLLSSLSLNVFVMVGFVLSLLALLFLLRDRFFNAPKRYASKDLADYILRTKTLNGSELKVHHALMKRFSATHLVLAMVRIEDVISVKNSVRDKVVRASRRGRIKSRHFDHVVLTKSGKPVFVVEFDGPTHSKYGQRKVDQFKDVLCRAVGLPLIRVSHKDNINDIIDGISIT